MAKIWIAFTNEVTIAQSHFLWKLFIFIRNPMQHLLSCICVCLMIVGIALSESCISEIEFDVERTGTPIVSGILSNSPSERIISVMQTVEIEEIAEFIPATGRIFRNEILVGSMVEISKGQLRLPEDLILEEGNNYHIEVVLPDGTVIQSLAQSILPKASIPELEWQRTDILAGENHEGLPIEIPFVEILAIVENADAKNESFYRFQSEDVWLFREVPKPRVDTTVVYDTMKLLGGGILVDSMIVIEPDPVKDCFPRRDVSMYPSVLLRTGGLQTGRIEVPVMAREIDQSFLFQHYFNVYARRINRSTFDFYQKSERLIEASGTLYDEIPAPVIGNVFDVNDPDHRILGYVEFSLADTIRLSLSKLELHMFLHDDCRPLDGGPIVCRTVPAPDGSPPPPCKCWDCDSIFGVGSDIRPIWWEE